MRASDAQHFVRQLTSTSSIFEIPGQPNQRDPFWDENTLKRPAWSRTDGPPCAPMREITGRTTDDTNKELEMIVSGHDKKSTPSSTRRLLKASGTGPLRNDED